MAPVKRRPHARRDDQQRRQAREVPKDIRHAFQHAVPRCVAASHAPAGPCQGLLQARLLLYEALRGVELEAPARPGRTLQAGVVAEHIRLNEPHCAILVKQQIQAHTPEALPTVAVFYGIIIGGSVL